MAKYTKKQLKEMADEFLYHYNMGDMKSDIMLLHLCNITRQPEAVVLKTINEYSNYEGE